MMRIVTIGVRTGRRDASPSGIIPPIAASPYCSGERCASLGMVLPKRRISTYLGGLREPLPANHYAANDEGGEITSVALRTASDIITRETPLMIKLTPTSVPIAQAELDGHCM